MRPSSAARSAKRRTCNQSGRCSGWSGIHGARPLRAGRRWGMATRCRGRSEAFHLPGPSGPESCPATRGTSGSARGTPATRGLAGPLQQCVQAGQTHVRVKAASSSASAAVQRIGQSVSHSTGGNSECLCGLPLHHLRLVRQQPRQFARSADADLTVPRECPAPGRSLVIQVWRSLSMTASRSSTETRARHLHIFASSLLAATPAAKDRRGEASTGFNPQPTPSSSSELVARRLRCAEVIHQQVAVMV